MTGIWFPLGNANQSRTILSTKRVPTSFPPKMLELFAPFQISKPQTASTISKWKTTCSWQLQFSYRIRVGTPETESKKLPPALSASSALNHDTSDALTSSSATATCRNTTTDSDILAEVAGKRTLRQLL